jgi:hypothetical protein
VYIPPMVFIKNSKFLASVAVVVLTLLGASFLPAAPVYACKQNQQFNSATGKCDDKCADGQIYTSIALNGNNHCVDNSQGNSTDITKNPIYGFLIIAIKFLSAGVGIAVVGGIVWGGILYASSTDNASQKQRAVSVIINALIGLLLYVFMFAIINYLIPGGILT